MEPNPYQSPCYPTLAPPVPAEMPVVVFDPDRVKALVRPRATALMAVAILSLPIDLAAFGYSMFVEAPRSVSDFSSGEGLLVAVSLVLGFGLLFLLHVFVVFGMMEMWRLRNGKYARLAMVISIVPSISPFYVL